MTRFVLLARVHSTVATAMVILGAIATRIMCLDKVFQFAALRVTTDPSYASALGVAGSNALVLLLLDIHNYGYLIAQIFFGLWLVPLGYLAYTSKMFPRALGVVLIAAGISYVLDLLVAFVSPSLSRTVHTYFAILPTSAEVWDIGDLLVFGVRSAAVGGRAATAI